MKKKKFYKIGITPGDPFGIGYEVIIKALNKFKNGNLLFYIYGDEKYFIDIQHILRISLNFENIVFKQIYTINEIPLKHPSKIGSIFALDSLNYAISDIKQGKIDALVTLPVSKEGINKLGIKFQGHTEYLARKFGLDPFLDVVMSFFSSGVIIGLHTAHIPLKKVSSFIKYDLLKRKIELFKKSLKNLLSKKVKIGILSQNPHSGEGGFIGDEEKIIKKVIKSVKGTYGPFSSDSYFARKIYKNFKATYALYHDQGLIPFKMISKGKGCNLTLGLPFLRVSPEHGPGYDIRKKFTASSISMEYCIKLLKKMLIK